ncbi:MAG: class I SAM-dependent methyltransferase, partial [Bdellovibrionota bacterium]
MVTKTEIGDVSDTSLWVATYRAEETERPDALFRDPYARVLAGEKGARIARSMKSSRYVRWSVVIRTHIIDSYIRSLLEEGVDTV